MYAANGAGVVLAEKGRFDVSKDIFTQVSQNILLIVCFGHDMIKKKSYLGLTLPSVGA